MELLVAAVVGPVAAVVGPVAAVVGTVVMEDGEPSPVAPCSFTSKTSSLIPFHLCK